MVGGRKRTKRGEVDIGITNSKLNATDRAVRNDVRHADRVAAGCVLYTVGGHLLACGYEHPIRVCAWYGVCFLVSECH